RVANDPDLIPRRDAGAEISQTLFHGLDDFDGVGARLPANLQQHLAAAVDVGDRVRVGFAVLDAGDVGHLDRVTVFFADHDVAEGAHVVHATARAQRHRLRPLIEPAAGDF